MTAGDAEATHAPVHGATAASRTLVVTVAMIGYALLAAFARPLTLPSVATVLVPGGALLWWGVRRIPIRTIRVSRTTAATWIGLGLVFCAWELVAFYSGNDAAHPTLSLLTDPVLATYPGRVAGYLLWLRVGAWLVTR
jgi:hypothetical protein